MKTKDFTLASTLITLGYPHEPKRLNEKTVEFLFPDSQELEDIVRQFWNKQLLVEPIALSQNMRMLKTVIHS